MRIYQRTISTWVQFSGIGLHTGMPSFARILPAAPDTGSLVRVRHSGSFSVVANGLDRPTSVEFIRGTAYVITIPGDIWEIDCR